jgi:hypothetical protein
MVGNGAHDDDLADLAASHAELVADAWRPTRLGSLAVELDATTLDGLLGKRARLEETRCPQPLV